MRKILFLCIMLAALFTSAVYAQTGEQQVRMTFPDVPSSHWASKHVTKLSLLELTRGDDTGHFNPNDTLSKQDAIIMAVRMMGLESEVPNQVETVLPFEVRDYAKPYIILAIDKELINIREEQQALQNDGSLIPWGDRAAEREWVTSIVIRAIGQQQEAIKLNQQLTGFTDHTNISANAVGSVNMAVQLGIVTGFEDGSFLPQGTVTRAQMATFLSRAEKYLPERLPRADAGLVLERTAQRITIQNDKGEVNSYQLAGNAAYYSAKSETARIAPSDIKEHYEVYLIHHEGIAYFVELTKDQVMVETLTGTLVSVSVADMKITYRNAAGEELILPLATNVAVMNNEGIGMSLGSLLTESELEMKRSPVQAGGTVVQIIVKKVPFNKTGEAVFESVNTTERTITYLINNLPETYPYSQALTVSYGNETRSLGELNAGDKIHFEIRNSIVTSIELLQPIVEKVDQGTLDLLRIDIRRLNILKPDGSLSAYDINPSAIVQIQGKEWSGLSDLEIGDSITLHINGGKVDKIIVTNRNIQPDVILTIVNYDAATKFLTVRDEDGGGTVYTLDETATLLLDGNVISFNMLGQLFTKDKKVRVTVSNNRILEMELANRFEGTITNINTSRSEMTVRLPSNRTITYPYLPGPIVEVYNKPAGGTVADLKAGDEVRVMLNWDQNAISQIVKRETVMYTLTNVKEDTRELSVRSENGEYLLYRLDATTPIVNQGRAAAVKDLKVNEPIVLKFDGKKVVQVTLVPMTRGMITGVDTARSSITLLDYSQKQHVISLGNSFSVKQGGSVSHSIQTLQANQRVELYQDEKGAYTIAIIPGERKTFLRYNADTHQISFRRVMISEQQTFDLHPEVYVHKGTSLSSLLLLQDGDEVIIYIVNNKIIEVEIR